MLIARVNGRQRGFTLIELMIAVVLVAVSLALVAPSIRLWLQNAQVRTVAESIQNGLQFAHNDALNRNDLTEFTLNSDTSWTVVAHTTGAADRTIEQRPAGEGASDTVTIAMVPDGATAVFNGLGHVDNLAPLTQVDVTSTVSGTNALRIQIDPGGEIRMCNPAVTSTSDPRHCL